jgi:hypothetical protein
MERSSILRLLYLYIKLWFTEALMEMAWRRDDSWTALGYEASIKEIKRQIDEY